jgi:GT2 family glycosyltransferase
MAKARVLVVLPTLGERLSFLEEALGSIQAQGSIADCVVVAPDRKEVRALAKRFGATWLEDPATGIAAAVNVGLTARVHHEFYAWLGDDDLFRLGGLELLLSLLDSDDDAVLAYGACDYILDDGQVVGVSKAGKLARFLLPWGPDLIPHPGTMIRFDDLEAIGGFDESLKFTLDLDAFLKLRKRGRFVSTTHTVSAFRWHTQSLTVSDRRGSSAEAMAVKKRHLPPFLRPLHFLWSYPVAWASALAAQLLVRRAKRLAGTNAVTNTPGG